MRKGLLFEICRMALRTIFAQRMRSSLTVLGIVIGVTSIVGVTSMVRGFDEDLREMMSLVGPNTIFMTQFSGESLSSGDSFFDLLQRPNLTPDDATAIARLVPSLSSVNLVLGDGGPPTREQLHYQGHRTKTLNIMGSEENYLDAVHGTLDMGRFFTAGEISHRRAVVVIGQTAYQALFPHLDPIGKSIRIGSHAYTVIGVLAPLASPGGVDVGVDDIAIIPYTAYQKQFGIKATRAMGGQLKSILITAIPNDQTDRNQAMQEIETVMRIRHGLRLDDPNDFDLMTSETIMRLWDRITEAVYLALVAISSIALLVGGIGVMAIMTISVKERTREIGARKAFGARRREILWQFLLEAVFLAAVGGIIGSALGVALGVVVHYVTGFPIALPLWSFAIGVGFSAFVGIVFGLLPAVRASGLDPIEALHYQ